MGATGVVTVLWRLVLPLCLLAAVYLRGSGISLLYMCLLLVGPAVPKPKVFARSGASVYVFTALATSLIAVLAQSVFQIFFVASASSLGVPYPGDWTCGSYKERIVRYVGFQPLNSDEPLHVCRLVLPDVVILIVSIATAWVSHRFLPSTVAGGRRASDGTALDDLDVDVFTSAHDISPQRQQGDTRPAAAAAAGGTPGQDNNAVVSKNDGLNTAGGTPRQQHSMTSGPPLLHRQITRLTSLVFEDTTVSAAAMSTMYGGERRELRMAPWVYDLFLTLDFTLLLLCASLVPSALSFPYFAVVLCAFLSWPVSAKRVSRSVVTALHSCGAAYLALHALALYAGQQGLFRDNVEGTWNDSHVSYFIFRLLGLDPLVSVSCDRPTVPTILSHSFPYFCHLPVVLFTYSWFILQLRTQSQQQMPANQSRLSQPQPTNASLDVNYRPTAGSSVSDAVSTSPVHARRRKKEENQSLIGAEYQPSYQSVTQTGPSGVTSPLSSSQRPVSPSGQAPNPQPASTEGHPDLNKSNKASDWKDGEQQPGVFLLGESAADIGGEGQGKRSARVRSAWWSIFRLVKQSSYLITFISMMAWSVVYHSWLAFVLLILACILWLTPNCRRATLFTSPAVLVYSVLLLLVEYANGINSPDGAAPPIFFNYTTLLDHIGLKRNDQTAFVTLLIKTICTMVFCLTARQFVVERRHRQNNRVPSDGRALDSTVMKLLGGWLFSIMSKSWIILLSGFFLAVSIQQPYAYRVIYLILFLLYVTVFQVSFKVWRLLLKPFLWILAIYSIAVIGLVYTFSFHEILLNFQNATGLENNILHDLGFNPEVDLDNDKVTLLIRLIVPAVFYVTIMLQLHIFHDKFMASTDLQSYVNTHQCNVYGSSRESEDNLSIDLDKGFLDSFSKFVARSVRRVLPYLIACKNTLWRVADVHQAKVVAFTIVYVCLQEPSAPNFVLLTTLLFLMTVGHRVFPVMAVLVQIWVGIIILAKMLFQFETVEKSYSNSTCNATGVPDFDQIDAAAWFGLEKSTSVPYYLSGFIVITAVLVLSSVVRIRENYYYTIPQHQKPAPGLIFSGTTRAQADSSTANLIMFFINYGFYKFGVEICFVTAATVIGARSDAVAVAYGVLLGVAVVLYTVRRSYCARAWPVYMALLTLLFFVQYLSALGLPPFLCLRYPDYAWFTEPLIQGWLYLPSYDKYHSPDPMVMLGDFFQLLFVICQMRSFQREGGAMASAGGSNEITNPQRGSITGLHDFIASKRNFVDVLKTAVFLYWYWACLFIIFISGTASINLFSLGYMVVVFYLCWHGLDIFEKSQARLLKIWRGLIWYTVFVIILKTGLQLVGCVYLKDIVDFSLTQFDQESSGGCVFVQLFSIVCRREEVSSTCDLKPSDASLTFDVVCFAFLVLQRRIFLSQFFYITIAEVRSSSTISNRGAFFIHKLTADRVEKHRKAERETLEKIKRKLDRLKMRQERLARGVSQDITRPSEHWDHYARIRAGGEYMFEVDSDDDSTIDTTIAGAGARPPPGPSPSTPTLLQDGRMSPLGLIAAALDGGLRTSLEEGEAARRESTVSAAQSQSATTVRSAGKSKRTGEPTARQQQKPKRVSEDVNAEWSASPDADELELPSAADRPSASQNSVAESAERYEDASGQYQEEGGSGFAGDKGEFPRKVPAQITPRGSQREETEEKESMWEKIKLVFRFLHALFISFVNYVIDNLGSISRDYFLVASKLDEEKAIVKEQILKEMEEVGQQEGAPRHDGDSVTGHALPRLTDSNSNSQQQLPLQSLFGRVTVQDLERKGDSLEDRSKVYLFFQSVYLALVSRTELICLFAMVLNCLAQGTILSLPLPLAAFLWGMLSLPRPSKRFWVTIIGYTELVVILKYIAQFNIVSSIWYSDKGNTGPFWAPRILGLEKIDGYYAYYELALLFCLFIHRTILKRYGLWKDAEESSGSVAQSQHGSSTDTELSEFHLGTRRTQDNLSNQGRSGHYSQRSSIVSEDSDSVSVASTDAVTAVTQVPTPLPSSSAQPPSVITASASDIQLLPVSGPSRSGGVDDDDGEIIRVNEPSHVDRDGEGVDEAGNIDSARFGRTQNKTVLQRAWSSVKTWYMDVTDPTKLGATTDVYAPIFACDFINFFILVFGYASFGPVREGAGNVTDYFEANRIPTMFLLLLLIQFALIVADRALYLRKFVAGKLVFQVGVVILIHVWLLFILPPITGRSFSENPVAQVWYFVKCIYFALSAYQVRKGYPTRILGNFLTTKYNYLNLFLYKGFLLVPFLLELRCVMDWIWTESSFGISTWILMEDIYAKIYVLKCWRTAEERYPTAPGQNRSRLVKYGVGGLLLFILFFIIWFPLLIFSFANAVFSANLPGACTVSLSLGGYQPLFQLKAQVQDFRPATTTEFDLMRSRSSTTSNKGLSLYIDDYDYTDVSVVRVSGKASAVWGIAPPSKDQLKTNLLNQNETLKMRMDVEFTKNVAADEGAAVVRGSFSYDLDQDLRNQLWSVLNGNQTHVVFDQLFPRYIHVPAQGSVTGISQFHCKRPCHWSEATRPYSDLSVSVSSTRVPSGDTPAATNITVIEWWESGELTNVTDPYDVVPAPRDRTLVSDPELTFVTFNERVAPASFSFVTGYGIIGLYVSIVFVIGQFVRSFLSNGMFTIMFEELPNVDRILQLCNNVYFVRENKELLVEEQLFSKLIHLFRSPETLVKWTRLKKTN